MKKSIKKLAAVMMAVSLTMSMGIPVYAGSITITANGNKTVNGEFQAHRILDLATANNYVVKYDDASGKYYVYESDGTTPVMIDGSQATKDDIKGTYTVNSKYRGILTDVIDALNGSENAPADDAAIVSYITSKVKPDGTSVANGEITARQFADAVRAAILANNITADETETGVGADITFDGLDNGYWLVIQTSINDGASSLCILDNVAGEAVIKVKAEAPEVEKKVADDHDTNAAGEAQYSDMAAWDIGDDVPFRFESTVVDLSGYSTYKYTFHDQPSAGLTFDPNSHDVKVLLVRGGTEYDITNDASVSAEDSTGGFQIIVNDLLKLDNAADASGNAVAGLKAEQGDKIIVTFTMKLNEKANVGSAGNINEVYVEYPNNPYASGDGNTSNTPKDTVVVFTFGLDIDKINDNDTPDKLEGAEFELYPSNAAGTGAANDNIKVKAVYKTVGGNQVVDYFVVDPTLTTSDKIVTNSSGDVVIKGLDEGIYFLRETKAPEGYNLLADDIKIVITATFAADRNTWSAADATTDALTKLEAVVEDKTAFIDTNSNGIMDTGEEDLKQDGLVPVTVVNHQGGLLPSTGGIGTTVFYVGGLVLMLTAAGYFVISKKKEQN